MSHQRENGTNIDNWTFEELIAQVEIYKNMTKYQSTNLHSAQQQSLVQGSQVGDFKRKKAEEDAKEEEA